MIRPLGLAEVHWQAYREALRWPKTEFYFDGAGRLRCRIRTSESGPIYTFRPTANSTRSSTRPV